MKKIGNLEIENPFILAPMEAVNCASFRLLCKRRGAGLVFTDMIDADIFMKSVIENGEKSTLLKYVNPQQDERPLCIQIGGGKIETLVETCKIISKHCDMIDFNIGCPLGYMLGKKGGVYLMKHPNMLEKIVRELRSNISLPFSVKMRSGWDEGNVNALEIALMLEKLGVDAITIHGRTRKQMYRERADWVLARKIKDSVSIPVILSGDVTNTYMANRAFQHTKCDFLMIARGAMNNPSIFTYLNDDFQKVELEKPENTYMKVKKDVCRDFEEFLKLYREREVRYKFGELQDHALWSVRESKNVSLLKQEILKAKKEEELIRIVNKSLF